MLSDYFESEIEPLFGVSIEPRYKRAKREKINGQYSYKIRILNEKTNQSVYETVSCGKNKKDAITNFRRNESEIRSKYLDLGGYVLGISSF